MRPAPWVLVRGGGGCALPFAFAKNILEKFGRLKSIYYICTKVLEQVLAETKDEIFQFAIATQIKINREAIKKATE